MNASEAIATVHCVDATDIEQENRRAVLRAWVASRGGHAEVVRGARMSPAQASYLSQVMNGYSFGPRAARNMEERLGLPQRFLELPPPQIGVDQHVSESFVRIEPQKVTWEQLVAGEPTDELFRVPIPDDANAPEFPRGLEMIWSRTKERQIGSLVLVRDHHGRLHVRECWEGKAPGQWIAGARNRAYASFDSADDQLTLVAVAAFRGMP